MNSTNGSGIVRHQPKYDGFVAARGQREEVAEAISQHIERHFGPIDYVLHEVTSHLVAVHIYVIEPTEERPWRTLVTSGMSDLPMTVPAGHDISPYAELVLCLPADWPILGLPDEDGRDYWPIGMMKEVARLPHEYGTWVGAWHSLPNGDPALPYAPGTWFSGVVVTPMVTVDAEARVIEVPDGTKINLLALLPLHKAEIDLKVAQGTNALIAALDRGKVSEAFDPSRPSLV